jgi:hypothetical protein
MQEERPTSEQNQTRKTRGVSYYLLKSYPTSLHSEIIHHPGTKVVAAFHMPGQSCLWFRFLEEGFLNPVKRLQKKSPKRVSETQ